MRPLIVAPMASIPDTLIDLRDTVELPDNIEVVADRVAAGYREVRRRIDTSGNLFARHEMQSALIEVRRLRRRITVAPREAVR